MRMNGRITEQTKGTELDRATRTRRLKKNTFKCSAYLRVSWFAFFTKLRDNNRAKRGRLTRTGPKPRDGKGELMDELVVEAENSLGCDG